ncbi:hypothetical protein GGI25_004864 [Coemansia spiralis]|uniref:COPI associated protein n=2 Tax=Coemansia TaxID=4863 RepID=A0A9W8G5S6_9FUNG|nr:hypothetical protein BX070DRAFT_252218 [Coemansia spiralis]KAJ1991933.1 hypothetical protein EDC05_003087 [Coemansia umbellata]KAJ2625304.1 hypothetical protein GGI26_000774 [Coemansia sp. RSA 1358]KAJ2673049.1 hypothetical protein GGI25_004864 [Coemansia spiralis]
MTLPYILARRRFNFSRVLTLPLFVANSAMGILLFVQGCLSCTVGDVRHIMLGIACLFFGLLVVLAELIHVAALRMYASFFFSFCGRGLFYLAVGCISVDARTAELAIGLVLAIVGALFLAAALAPRLCFDDPEDQYVAVIYNIQHGIYATQQSPAAARVGGISAPLSNPSIGAYPSTQAISSEMFATGASSMPHRAASRYASSLSSSHIGPGGMEKPPRL